MTTDSERSHQYAQTGLKAVEGSITPKMKLRSLLLLAVATFGFGK